MPNLDRQIEQWGRKVNEAVKGFNRSDRKKLLRLAASPVRTEVKNQLKRSYKRPESSRGPHFRGSGDNRIQYNPGNLRRSQKTQTFRRSLDVFVGPRFARRRASEYGGVGQPTDGYYAHMIFGGATQFNSRILAPAVRKAGPNGLRRIRPGIRKSIKTQAARRGIKTNS